MECICQRQKCGLPSASLGLRAKSAIYDFLVPEVFGLPVIMDRKGSTSSTNVVLVVVLVVIVSFSIR